MINGKQIISLFWDKITGFIKIKENTDYPSLVVGKERFDLEIESVSRISNIVYITFKQAVRVNPSNIVIKSPTTLGLASWTLVPVINPTFPILLNVYQIQLNLAGADFTTTVNDIEIRSFSQHLNSIGISNITRFGTLNTITTNAPHLNIFASMGGTEIECIAAGLLLTTHNSYTLTSTGANTFTFSSALGGSVLTAVTGTVNIPNPSIKFYNGGGGLENTRSGVVNLLSPTKRDSNSNSASRSIYLDSYIDWRNGTRSVDSISSSFIFVGDLTGEYIMPNPCDIRGFNNSVRLTNSRQRLHPSSTYSQNSTAGAEFNISPTDTSYLSTSICFPKYPSVSIHGTVSVLTNVATINTTQPHGLVMGDVVTVNSTLLSLVNSSRTITVTGISTYTFPLVVADISGTDTGYTFRTATSNLLSVSRDASNIVTLTFTSAHNIISGSWISVTSAILGFSALSNIARNVTSTTIQFISTGAVVPTTIETNGIVTTSNKYVTRSINKSKDLRTFGWYIAGTEPANTAADQFFYDRNNVGHYSDMPAPTATLGSWNHFVPTNNSARSKFGRYNYFGNLIPTIAYPNDVNIVSEGAIQIGNTITGTPIDGTLSKITNGDVNYFSNGAWRGVLYVLGGGGANTNIITNTANALLKAVGNGLEAISSLLFDNGDTLSYKGIGGISTLRNTRYSTVTETPIVTSATATNLLTTVTGVTYKAPISGLVSGGNVFTIADILNNDTTKRLKIEFNASAITGFTAGATITICFGASGTTVLGTFTIPTLNAGIGEVLTSLSINAELIVKTRGGSGTFSLDGIASLRSAGATGGGNAYTYSNRDIHLTQSVGTFNTAQTNLLMLRATTPAAGTVTVSKFNLIVMS